MEVFDIQFSKIKKRAKEFLAPSLKHRIDIHATVYRKFQDSQSRVWLTFDGQEIFMAEEINFDKIKEEKYNLLKHKLPSRPSELTALTVEIFLSDWYLKSSELYESIEAQLNEEGLFDNYAVQNGLLHYPNLSLQEALTHKNLFIRGFALLDRRLGKRRLKLIQNTSLTAFEELCYNIRLQAEHDMKIVNKDITLT